MRLLDLFCGAGGCAVGYHRAGFTEIVGVDVKPQPRYPFEFVQGDALEYVVKYGREFDAIHASPPCQRYSEMTACRPGNSESHPDLIGDTRAALMRTKIPYAIENVGGARYSLKLPIMLCGTMFGLELYRHRWFETSINIIPPQHSRHRVPCSKAGHWKPGTFVSVCGNCAPVAKSRAAMGIDWMIRDELSQAVPPAYTEFIGRQLLHAIKTNEPRVT